MQRRAMTPENLQKLRYSRTMLATMLREASSKKTNLKVLYQNLSL